MLSIVTGTLNRPESLLRLFKTIVDNTDVPWEFVISNAGDPLSLDLHSELTRGAEKASERLGKPCWNIIITEKPRLGHVAGYNQAFRAASQEWVAWLNDDAIVMKGWAAQAISFMEKNKWIGMGALRYGTHGTPFVVNEYQGMPYANFGLIEREYGNKLGWFDQECCYFYGGDNSLAFRVFMDNRPVVGIPGEHVLHLPFYDKYRGENEELQPRDCHELMEKYTPFLPKMREVHEYYRREMIVQ